MKKLYILALLYFAAPMVILPMETDSSGDSWNNLSEEQQKQLMKREILLAMGDPLWEDMTPQQRSDYMKQEIKRELEGSCIEGSADCEQSSDEDNVQNSDDYNPSFDANNKPCCIKCDKDMKKPFANVGSFDRHIRQIHKQLTIWCNGDNGKCSKKYKSKSTWNLLTHRRKQHEDPYQCYGLGCKEAFSEDSGAREHRLICKYSQESHPRKIYRKNRQKAAVSPY